MSGCLLFKSARREDAVAFGGLTDDLMDLIEIKARRYGHVRPTQAVGVRPRDQLIGQLVGVLGCNAHSA
jgi:hypothetical protein